MKPFIDSDLGKLIKDEHRVQRSCRRYPHTYNRVTTAAAKRKFYSIENNSCSGNLKKNLVSTQ